MPTRPPSACPRPGCPHYQPCPDHPGSWSAGQRGRPMPPGWAATRERILARDPICRLALPGCSFVSHEVHHLHPGREDDAALAGVCPSCHRQVTQAQAAAARHR